MTSELAGPIRSANDVEPFASRKNASMLPLDGVLLLSETIFLKLVLHIFANK